MQGYNDSTVTAGLQEANVLKGSEPWDFYLSLVFWNFWTAIQEGCQRIKITRGNYSSFVVWNGYWVSDMIIIQY